MSSLATKDTTKATLEDVYHFAEERGRLGHYNETTARLYANALKQLVSIMGDEESRDPVSLLAAVDDLAERFAVKHKKSGTATTYKSRARALLDDYVQFLKDPLSTPKRRVRRSAPRAEKKSTTATKKSTRTTSKQDDAALIGNIRSFPLSDGRTISFTLPAGELPSSDDIGRFALHLLTLAKDFSPQHAQMVLSLKSDA